MPWLLFDYYKINKTNLNILYDPNKVLLEL